MGRDDINSLALVRTENELGHPQIQIRSQNTDSTPGHAKAAREGLATARPVVFAGRCHPVAPPSPRVSSLLRHLAYVPGVVGGRLLQVGLLTKDTHRNTIRFAPPLIIRESQVDRAVGKLTEVLEELASSSVQAQPNKRLPVRP